MIITKSNGIENREKYEEGTTNNNLHCRQIMFSQWSCQKRSPFIKYHFSYLLKKVIERRGMGGKPRCPFGDVLNMVVCNMHTQKREQSVL